MFFPKKNTYRIDIDQANTRLQNIFAVCDQAPNTIPFDKLVLRQKVNTKIYRRLLIITAIVLVLTFLSPFFIVPIANTLEHIMAPEPAKLLNDCVKNDILYLELSGENILYDEAYLETLDGQKIYAITYDAEEQTLAFPYIEDEESNIYVPIKNDAPLHFLLPPQ